MRIFGPMANKSAGPIKLFVLGDARIETPTAVIEPTAEIIFAVALFLILGRKEPSPRRALQRLLWPNVDTSTASHRLRQTLLKLRRMGIRVDTVGTSRVQIGNDSVSVDSEEFLRNTSTELELERLSLLPGYDPQFSAPYAEWLDAQRLGIG